LTGANPHSIADRAEHFAIPIELQELTVLAAGHPWIAVRVEPERADKISHLHRPEELPVRTVHDNAILLAIADPDVSI
jgi:hypothetical protein